jgi:hypothetical protein
MREDGRNASGLAGGFGCPGARVKVFDNILVYAIVSGKDADGGSGELSVGPMLTRAHGYSVPMHSRRSLTASHSCATTSRRSSLFNIGSR